MDLPTHELAASLAGILDEYASHGNAGELRRRLEAAVQRVAGGQVLRAAVEPYRDNPDVIAPVYERIVELEPTDAQALVILANAWWLQGRGPGPVGELASRAIAVDPSHRGAWHLWALSESDPRRRVQRWAQVAERFPGDDLALAAMADNAAAVAGAERDYDMLDLAIATFERLLARAEQPAQRDAVESALRSLRGWRL
ncbi:MAG TPA: hypothetical protein VLE53_17700 [Gemmatimonadaceae bacterium]|nr:hypothetical protein [Gemmatimonadaceae bacterium]